MKNALFLLAGLVATCAADRLCGTPEPTEKQIAESKAFYAVEKEARAAGNFSAAAQTIEVNVYFHVLSTSDAVEDGYISVCLPKYDTCVLECRDSDPKHRKKPSPFSWMP